MSHGKINSVNETFYLSIFLSLSNEEPMVKQTKLFIFFLSQITFKF